MHHYYIDSIFDFGKYQGQTLAEIVVSDPQYIVWCIATYDDYFKISDQTYTDLLNINPHFIAYFSYYPNLSFPLRAQINHLVWQSKKFSDTDQASETKK